MFDNNDLGIYGLKEIFYEIGYPDLVSKENIIRALIMAYQKGIDDEVESSMKDGKRNI